LFPDNQVIEVRDVRDDSDIHFYPDFDRGEAQLNRSETLRRGFGTKGTLPWEHREVRKRYPSLMVTLGESNIRCISEDFPQKVGRLTLRLLLALSLVAAITFVFSRLIHVNATSVGFFYLVAILVIATVGGLVEATASSIVAMLCFNFFFFPPIGTFTIADPQNWVALFAFLTTALTASQLSGRLKRQRREALNRQCEMERLYALSRAILLTDTTQPTAKQIVNQIAKAFECPAVALYDRKTSEVYLADREAFPNISSIDAKLRESAIQSSVLQEGDQILITPIRLGGEPIGSLALTHTFLSDAALQSLLNLVAVGLEKARAQEEVNRAQVARQSEELKSTLLDAIAHEFKTPLTSIKAVTTDLLSNPEESLSQQQRGLVAIADEGADRLDRLVTEAIQLARIEGGKFQLNRGVHFPSSLLSAALRQTKTLTDGRDIKLQMADDLPLVFVDAELIVLMIAHLIDNAVKYSRPGSPILISADAGKKGVIVHVADQGPGISQDEQTRIFEKFYRGSGGQHLKGTGMGLAIAREIIRAHGEEIWVKSRPDKGSEFSFSLPVAPVESTE
jgi:two-component system sensor histidine kinase KdpD